MTLLDIYEELFQKLCDLNRASKSPPEKHPHYERVRGDLLELLEKALQKAGSDVRLQNQARALELPMMFFVDNIICGSRLAFRDQWSQNRLAVTLRNDLAGDSRFFDLLGDDLRDASDDARERLAVYYCCLALGFTGQHIGEPQKLRQYMDQIYPRLGPYMNRQTASKLTEEAYKHTNTIVLTEPPSRMIVMIATGFIFLALTSVLFYYGLYQHAAQDVNKAIGQILSSAPK
jgi:type IV/VI secretion system ImpK/VasF family protein